MIKGDFRNVKRSDLVDVEVLVERFKEYLKKELDYSDAEAEIGALDMNDPYRASFVSQDHVGSHKIRMVEYEVRYCRTDFCRCGLFHLADVKPFEFYMLFEKASLKSNTVASYMDANKKFIIL